MMEMNFVYLIICSIMVLICFYFIISPFFGPKEKIEFSKTNQENSITLDAIYATVNEMEMDLLMKKMAEEDFHRLKQQYQFLASEIMKKEKKEKTKIEMEIMKELQKIRDGKEI